MGTRTLRKMTYERFGSCAYTDYPLSLLSSCMLRTKNWKFLYQKSLFPVWEEKKTTTCSPSDRNASLLHSMIFNIRYCSSYSIIETGEHLKLASDDFLKSTGMEPVSFLSHELALRKQEDIVLLLSKVLEYFILAGTEKAARWFSKKLNAFFKVETGTDAPGYLQFKGPLLQQNRKRYIKVSIK